MDPILDKARAGQNALERLMNAIPGFKGYREHELRRDSDRVQREYLATRLDECKKKLNDVANALTRQGNLDAINDVEAARKKIDKAANRIRYADRGYSGFFATIKVDEAMLGRVYEFDLQLLAGVDQVRAAADRSHLGDMITALDALDTKLNEREAILSGIQ